MAEQSKRLTAAQCHAKAAECLEMAALARDASHKIMFQHMADTWQRIAKDVSDPGQNN